MLFTIGLTALALASAAFAQTVSLVQLLPTELNTLNLNHATRWSKWARRQLQLEVSSNTLPIISTRPTALSLLSAFPERR